MNAGRYPFPIFSAPQGSQCTFPDASKPLAYAFGIPTCMLCVHRLGSRDTAASPQDGCGAAGSDSSSSSSSDEHEGNSTEAMVDAARETGKEFLHTAFVDWEAMAGVCEARGYYRDLHGRLRAAHFDYCFVVGCFGGAAWN